MPDQGYVNQGTDPRILGKPAAAVQRKLSFKSPDEPQYRLWSSENGQWQLMVARSVPRNLPFVSIVVPRPFSDRLMTFRTGWRYDKYWGDENVQGYNPQPEIVGGYIADVIVKLNQSKVVHY
jgi:hypothetical protein